MRKRGGFAIVEPAFLELCPPTIEDGGRRCVALGAERVLMIPYFLSAGVHVRDDLTASRRRLSELFPAVDFKLAEPMGRHPLLLDIVEQRASEAATSPG